MSFRIPVSSTSILAKICPFGPLLFILLPLVFGILIGGIGPTPAFGASGSIDITAYRNKLSGLPANVLRIARSDTPENCLKALAQFLHDEPRRPAPWVAFRAQSACALAAKNRDYALAATSDGLALRGSDSDLLALKALALDLPSPALSTASGSTASGSTASGPTATGQTSSSTPPVQISPTTQISQNSSALNNTSKNTAVANSGVPSAAAQRESYIGALTEALVFDRFTAISRLETLLLLGRTLNDTSQSNRAVSILERWVTREPLARGLLIESYTKAGNRAKALDVSEKYLAQGKPDPSIVRARVRALLVAGDRVLYKADFQEALKLLKSINAPEDALLRAQALLKLNRPGDALTELANQSGDDVDALREQAQIEVTAQNPTAEKNTAEKNLLQP